MCFAHIVTIILQCAQKHKKNFLKLASGTGLDDLVGQGLGQLGVVAGLHSVVATALGITLLTKICIVKATIFPVVM